MWFIVKGVVVIVSWLLICLVVGKVWCRCVVGLVCGRKCSGMLSVLVVVCRCGLVICVLLVSKLLSVVVVRLVLISVWCIVFVVVLVGLSVVSM